MGIGRHDLGTIQSIPVRGLDLLSRPHSLVYFVLPVDVAYAVEWWLLLAMPVIGLYLIFVHIGLRVLPAALCSCVVALNPVVHWWTIPDIGVVAGYLSLSVVLLLKAGTARSRTGRIVVAMLGGWAAGCGILSLYVPIVVPFVILFLFAYAIIEFGDGSQRSGRLLAALGTSLIAAVVCSLVLAQEYVRHRTAIAAMTGTIYPGRRSVAGGRGGLVFLFGAPYTSAVARPLVGTMNGLNASESSAGLLLWLPALAVLAVSGRQNLPALWRQATQIIGVVVACFLAWYLLPIPRRVGQLLMFDRIPAQRMLFAIAAGSVLMFGFLLRALQDSPLGRRTALGVGFLFYAVTVVIGSAITVGDVPLRNATLFLLPIPLLVGIALALGRRQALGLSIIVVFLVWSVAHVNPLARGLDPLLEHPVRQSLIRLDKQFPGSTVALVDLPPEKLGAAVASGMNVFGATNFYPSEYAWRVFDPDGRSESTWNRFATVYLQYATKEASGTISLIQSDAALLTVWPCDVRLQRFDVRFILTDRELSDGCLTEIETVAVDNTITHLYEITG